MKQSIYFTPGPSQLYFTVESHIKKALKTGVASISHRSARYKEIHAQTTANLRALLDIPTDYHILFTASATEVWERLIQNTVAQESFHFVNGAFSGKFHNIATNLGVKALDHTVPEGQIVDVDSVLIPESAELIALTHNETSTGASYPLEDIYKIRKAFPDHLLAVDIVSSAPAVALDLAQVDSAYFSVQKCFGLPAGLGVWIVNDRCLQKCEQLMNEGRSVGSYHSLPELISKAAANQTPETPNVLGIYLLGKVAGDILSKGKDELIRETNYKSALMYHTFKESPYLSPFVPQERHRSKTTPVATTTVSSKEILQALAAKGLVVGSGYGKYKDEHIRIANFPTHSREQMELLSDQLLALKF